MNALWNTRPSTLMVRHRNWWRPSGPGMKWSTLSVKRPESLHTVSSPNTSRLKRSTKSSWLKIGGTNNTCTSSRKRTSLSTSSRQGSLGLSEPRRKKRPLPQPQPLLPPPPRLPQQQQPSRLKATNTQNRCRACHTPNSAPHPISSLACRPHLHRRHHSMLMRPAKATRTDRPSRMLGLVLLELRMCMLCTRTTLPHHGMRRLPSASHQTCQACLVGVPTGDPRVPTSLVDSSQRNYRDGGRRSKDTVRVPLALYLRQWRRKEKHQAELPPHHHRVLRTLPRRSTPEQPPRHPKETTKSDIWN
mmetsp:Transcript_16070/g.47150  ORF Transcript_16070/g.47150 Transcript_16070/m.47150 type:complete len:303 (+) Transcript_16070:691-1599(+)